jgi:murein DD-endopeptidase MepM/ murein hydrolase activator NlpD
MLIYLIEAATAFGIMYAFYQNVFFQTTHFEWNRAYFYFAVFISLAIPLISFPFKIDFTSSVRPDYILNPLTGENLIIYREHTGIFSKISHWLNSGSYLNIKNILYIIYFSGVLRFLYLFVRNQLEIYHLVKRSKTINHKKWIQVIIDENETAFSYFRYIFTGNNYEQLSIEEQKNVIEHEKIHAFELHSLDILLYELYEIIFWFNPFVRKAKKTLKDLHEYIVDIRITQSASKYRYADLLIKLSTGKPKTKLANLFSRNPLKDRIRLLAFPEGEQLKKFRFITGIPVIVFILITYSFIISNFNQATNNLQITGKTAFSSPVDYGTEIISGYFENKELKSDDNYKIIAAHREITYATESYQQIKSCGDGEVADIKQEDDWGLMVVEITIIHNKKFSSKYKGLWKAKVAKGEKVKAEQLIGLMGDKRLYESFSFQLLQNGKPVNPVNFIQ